MRKTSAKEILVSLLAALMFSWFLSLMPQKIKISISSAVSRTVFAPFSAISNAYWSVRTISADMYQLKHKVAQLSAEIQFLREAQIENARLRRLLQLKDQYGMDLVLAQVVGISTPEKLGFLIVSCGVDEGIEENMPVITPDGVIGKVVSVSHDISTIQTLADPGFSVSAMSSRSRVIGVVSIGEGGMLVMKNIPLGADIVVGDKIITSGYGGIFPKGLVIGTVVRVLDKPDKLFKYVMVQPSASLSNIEEVFIIKESPLDSLGNT